ncbi:hypothetical protein Tco_0243661 [Tanacetum coccineum]
MDQRLFNTTAGNPVKKILLKLNLSDHKSILTDLKVTPTKPGRMTKPYSSPRFIANCFHAGQLKMVVEVPDSSWLTRSIARLHDRLKYIFQDFCYSDNKRLSRSDEVL